MTNPDKPILLAIMNALVLSFERSVRLHENLGGSDPSDHETIKKFYKSDKQALKEFIANLIEGKE